SIHALAPLGAIKFNMAGPVVDQPHGYCDVLEGKPLQLLLLRDWCVNADGTPDTDTPLNTIHLDIEEVAHRRTRMSIEIVFPSTDAMEQALAMGTDEGLSQAVSQIDAILAGEIIQR